MGLRGAVASPATPRDSAERWVSTIVQRDSAEWSWSVVSIRGVVAWRVEAPFLARIALEPGDAVRCRRALNPVQD